MYKFWIINIYYIVKIEIILGETPLHIAIVYNDINSVKLLIKHGVDVNKRVVGDFNAQESNRNKDETKKGRRKRTRPLFRRNDAPEKQFNPQIGNPESKWIVIFYNSIFKNYFVKVMHIMVNIH